MGPTEVGPIDAGRPILSHTAYRRPRRTVPCTIAVVSSHSSQRHHLVVVVAAAAAAETTICVMFVSEM